MLFIFRSNISEWLIQNTYEKPIENARTNSSSVGSIHEIVHLSKGVGFKHVVPIKLQTEANLLSAKNLKDAVKNEELLCSSLETVENNKKNTCDEGMLDCVYIIASSHPLFSNQ